MKIEGISAFVTGGASGLGAATTRLLVERGARVAFYDLPRSNGGELEKELSGSARFLPGDVTDESGVDAALEAAADAFGPLRAVVNCAGIGSAQRTVGREGQPFPLENFRRTVEVNLIGTFNVIRLAAKRMVGNEPNADGERGAIVNTASVAAFEGQIGQAAYSASKGGASWACPSPPCRPWARASRSRRAWESRPSTPRSPARSSRTPCSTARRSASTGRSAWRRSSRR
jgi:NAD(P)-dependent dehydrogenase (short-subunit alcohol dehydrogenase family)